MPHIELKVYPGYSQQKLSMLAQQLVSQTAQTLGVPERVVSMAIAAVPPEDWNEQVFEPLINGRRELVKAPEYH